MSWNPTFTELGLQFYFGIGSPTRPTAFFASQHTASPGTTGANEASGNNYNRVAISFQDAAGQGQVENDAAAETNLATPGPVGTVSHYGVWSASTAGTYYSSGAYTGGPVLWDTDKKLIWGIGDITATLRGTAPSQYSDAAMQAIALWLFNVGGVPTVPSSWFISFHFGAPGQTGASEFSATNGYGRQSGTTWQTGSAGDGIIENVAAGESPTSTGAWSNGGVATHFGVWDNATVGAGAFLVGGTLSQSQTIDGAGQKIEWPSGGILIPMLGV